jgi:hypothetical protein
MYNHIKRFSLDLTGLITFWALALAAFAVLPEYWKFRIKAFIGSAGVIISTSIALLLSSWLVCWSMFMLDDGWKIGAQIAAFLVLLLYIAFWAIRLFRGKLSKGNLQRFRELMSSLSRNRQYEILTKVVKDNIKHLPVIYNYKPRTIRLLSFKKREPEIEEAPWKPNPVSKHQEGIIKLADQITSDQNFTEFVVNYDIETPLSFIETCENQIYGVAEYTDTVLELLISNPESQLYREIQRNQNIGRGKRREFSNSRLLKFLFKNAELAEKRAIWQPIGNHITRFLHGRPGGADDSYNKEADYYTSNLTNDRFSDPVFVGLEFFDFMVKEALLQNINWHMFLYYFHYWTNEIVNKAHYDQDEWNRGYWEFPTKYTFLLYRIISYQLDWFQCARENSLNIGLAEDANTNGNILQSAAICLTRCLRSICECKELPDKFKRSLLTLWWDHYFELDINSNSNYPQYAAFMLKTLVDEVEGTFRKHISFSLLGHIASGLTHADEIKEWVNNQTYKDRLSDIEQLLRNHVIPILKATPPAARDEVLVNTLGTEFKLDNNTISVTNRFNSWTKLADIG